ncbi:MAG: choice-of-anchor J domain-containing protein [Prevotellaceae bacterium]|nr:choice-of-anchor J domain-containing protein [Prevotellaceae bacterium]
MTPVLGQLPFKPDAAVLKKVKASDKNRTTAELKKKYPALVLPMSLSSKGQSSQLRSTLSPMNAHVRKSPNGVERKTILKLGDGRELLGNVVYKASWPTDSPEYGIYKFNASSPITVSEVAVNGIVSNAGGAFVDDEYHSIYLDTSYASIGYYALYHTAYSSDDWSITTSRESLRDFTLAAIETAVYNETETVYGEFYTSNMSGIEFGIADYNAKTRTTIGTATNVYVALGITSDKVMYGVANDGNLYRIDTTTGEETLVGATGLVISNSEGRYYGQSGEIDQTTNTFYWAAIDINGNSALYTIDLTTGAASKISDFPDGEEIYSLSISYPDAEDGAPAAATDLAVAFDGASLSGTISFTAPSVTFGGASMTGDLTYKVYVDGDVIKEGTANVGETISEDITVDTPDTYKFMVIFSNSVGNGAKAKLTKYVGHDTPDVVSDVVLSVNKETGEANLSWTAPSKGLNGGYIGDITYTVVRYPDNVTVATGLTETSFSEVLDAVTMTSYSYGVTAVNGTKASAETKSNGEILGSVVVPPYLETFDDESSMGLFTVIDNNNDGSTWAYNSHNVAYNYNSYNSGDDWLITPPIQLEANKVYTVSFNAHSYINYYPERIEVKYGNSNNPDNLTNVILPVTDLTSQSDHIYSADIVTNDAQMLYVGFHALSDPDMFAIIVDDIAVSAGLSASTPDSVTNVLIVPSANGDLTATISFNAPKVAYSGAELTSLTKIEIERNGTLVKTFENPVPGESLSFTDETDVNGTNTYTFTAYNEDGVGRKKEVSAYIGYDIPAMVQNIKAADNFTSIKLDWDKISSVGASGGVVDPDQVTYNVYSLSVNSYGNTDTLRIASVKDNTYSVEINTTEGEQDLIQYGLNAENKAGKGALNYSAVVLSGAPYLLPVNESVSGGKITYLWYTDYTGNSIFDVTTSASSDNDKGCFILSPKDANDIAWINSGKISLAGATNPEVVFDHYSTPGEPLKLTVEFQKPNGDILDVKTIDYSSMTGEAKWITENIKFTDEYKSLPYVLVNFRVNVEGDAYSSLYIDNISIRDVYQYDLSVSVTAPEKLSKGQTGNLNVKVSNQGDNTISNYTIKVSDGDKEIASYNETEAIASFANKEYTIPYETSVFDDASEANIKVDVTTDIDLYEDNNTAYATIALYGSDLATPSNVTATETSVGEITVNWVCPSTTIETKTEDFESYDPWTIDEFGDWTTIDVDGGLANALFQNTSYPHQGEPFAFMIFNPEDMFEGCVEANPTLAPHSGNQYASAVYTTDPSTGDWLNSDNWLISPILPGTAQTISFWARTGNYYYYESFDVLYSTSGTEISDFTKLGSTYSLTDSDWKQITVDLPEGTTHFAIHHNTSYYDSFFFMIDDITYTTGAAAPIGYNIYRDEVKVGNTAADVTTYVDSSVPEGNHNYSVTAVYSNGESSPVSASITTVIESLNVENSETYTVYTLDGKLIGRDLDSLKKLNKGVYIINNKKVEIK